MLPHLSNHVMHKQKLKCKHTELHLPLSLCFVGHCRHGNAFCYFSWQGGHSITQKQQCCGRNAEGPEAPLPQNNARRLFWPQTTVHRPVPQVLSVHEKRSKRTKCPANAQCHSPRNPSSLLACPGPAGAFGTGKDYT